MKDFSENKDIKTWYFLNESWVREIQDENVANLSPEQIFCNRAIQSRF